MRWNINWDYFLIDLLLIEILLWVILLTFPLQEKYMVIQVCSLRNRISCCNAIRSRHYATSWIYSTWPHRILLSDTLCQLPHVVFINTSASAMVTFIMHKRKFNVYVNTHPLTSPGNIKKNRESRIHVHDRHQPSFLAIPIISLDGRGWTS